MGCGTCRAQIRGCGRPGVLLTFSAWGPGGPGAPALPGNPGGPCVNKGAGRNEGGARGGTSPSFLLGLLHYGNRTHSDTFGLPRNTASERYCWLACRWRPTQEALPSRSWLLEAGLATQAVPPMHLPSLPRAHPSPAWPGQAHSSQIRSQRQGWLCGFTHRWAGKAWLALKSLGEEGRDSLRCRPRSQSWQPQWKE